MTKTYETTDNAGEEAITEVEIITTEKRQTYNKQWLIDEIARLQAILNQFPKEIEK